MNTWKGRRCDVCAHVLFVFPLCLLLAVGYIHSKAVFTLGRVLEPGMGLARAHMFTLTFHGLASFRTRHGFPNCAHSRGPGSRSIQLAV